jgi:hypothetical protein
MSELLDENQAAAYLRVRPQTLSVWRCRGRGPNFVRIGRLVKYRRIDLDQYIERNTVLLALDPPASPGF